MHAGYSYVKIGLENYQHKWLGGKNGVKCDKPHLTFHPLYAASIAHRLRLRTTFVRPH
jgi:hypothetical protein